MNFLNLQVLWLLPIALIIMIVFYFRAKLARQKALKLLLGERFKDQNFVLFSPSRRALRFILLIIAVCCLFFAIARPYWGSRLLPYESQGRDLMVVFDTSKSMLCSDIQPSRLAHAKWFVRQLASNNETDRFGLVAFAGYAFLECPLTTDRTSFFQYVDELDTITIPVGGTNVQLALEKALDAFKAAQGNNRAIILLTDGDELDGNSQKVIAELKKRKIPLFVVGIGDPFVASPIPIKQGVNPVFKRDKAGKLVKTRLNEPLLSKLASGTGGIYLRSTTADSGLSRLMKRINKLMPEELEASKRSQPIERFYYPLIAALILLLAWALISERNNSAKRSLATILILATLFSGQNSFAASSNLSDAKNHLSKLPVEATKQLKKTVVQQLDPRNEAIRAYNAGRELQLKKDAKAIEKYEQAINSAQAPQIRAQAYRNLGVINHNRARGEVGKGMGMVKQQNLDGALKQLKVAQTGLNQAEEMYVEAMTLENSLVQSKTSPPKKNQNPKDNDKNSVKPASQTGSVAMNQQLLLRDRTMIKKLKKQIEELKKQQQKAQKKLKQAQKKQQKKNKKQQQKKQDQQKKNKSDKQQQKKQNKQQQQNKQNKQQNKQDQQNAEQSLKDAQQSVDKLQNAAKKLQQKSLADAAKKAGKELNKARQAQQKDQGKVAEKHIKQAIDELAKQQKQQQKKNKSDKNRQQKKNKSDKQKDKKQDKKQDKQQNGQKDDKKLPKPQAQPAKGQQKKEKKIDPRQAKAIMKLMAAQEKNLRDAIKANRKKVYGNKKVKKDW